MSKSKQLSYPIFLFFIVGLVLISSFKAPVSLTGDAVYEELVRPSELFDVSVYLEYGEIKAGENQIVMTKIVNMGIEEAEDVLVKYTLKDGEGKVSEYAESVAVQTSMALVRQIYIPEGLPPGDYIIDVEVKYGSSEANASSTFIVKGLKTKWFTDKNLLFILVVLIVILLVLLVIAVLLFRFIKVLRARCC